MTFQDVNLIPSLPYEDWFGNGDTKDDVLQIVSEHGKPEVVLINGFLACLVYFDLIVITGYDGNEYQVHEEFKYND